MNSKFKIHIGNNLRTRLIISYQLLVAIFISTVSGFAYWHERESYIDANWQKLQTAAALKERAINSRLQEEMHIAAHLSGMGNFRDYSQVILSQTASHESVRSARGKLKQLMKKTLHEMPELRSMSILSASGKIIYEYTSADKVGEFQTVVTDFGSLGLDDVSIQIIQYKSDTLEPELVVSAPIIAKSGQKVGILRFSVSGAHLTEILYDTAGLGKTGETYLIDSKGNILLRGRDTDHSRSPSPVIGASISQGDGSGFYRNYRNDQVLSHYHWIDSMRVAIVADVSLDEALSPLKNFTMTLIVVALVILMLAFLVGKALAAQIAGPIMGVADTANRIAQGDLSLRVPESELEELATLSKSFNDMANALETSFQEKDLVYQETKKVNAQLQAATSAKNVFLANMSHELRTPLNAIIGYSELLKEEAEENELHGLVDDFGKIQNAGHHLLTLINDVLDVAKIEEGKIELHYEEFLIADFINSLYSVTQVLAKKNHNQLHFFCPADAGIMVADITRLKQSLINLISNAAKFTANGHIHLIVETAAENDQVWVSFTVWDTGVGIAPDKMERIFEQFSQADSSTTKEYGGTGLGLTLARQFVELMNGSLTVKSDPNQGAEFIVKLPVAPYSYLRNIKIQATAG